MSGSNPFRHKRTASSTAAATTITTPPPGTRTNVGRAAEPQGSEAGTGSRIPASSASAGTAAATYKSPIGEDEDEVQAVDDDTRSALSQSQSKSVRIASPPVDILIPPAEQPVVVPMARGSASTDTSTSTSTAISTSAVSQPVSAHRGSPPPREWSPERGDSEAEEEAEDDGVEAIDPFDSNRDGSGIDKVGVGGDEREVKRDTITTRPLDGQRKRATLDVDAFKRLMLTGEADSEMIAAPMQSTARSHERSASMGERVRDFEPEFYEESPLRPGISREASKVTLDGHESKTPAAQSRTPGKIKPPPPKPKHGKLLPSSERDISSFGIFSPPGSSDDPSVPSTVTSSPSSSQQGTRIVSDPPKPLSQSPLSSRRPSIQDRRAESRSEPFPGHTISVPKRPPTPPARRNSQLRANRPSPPITRSSSLRLTTTATGPPGSTAPSRTPPPPPTRRRDWGSSISSPSTSHTSDGISTTDPSHDSVPLPRSTSGSIRSVNRLLRISNASTATAPATGPIVPPRPPPPRRSGGSSQHSHSQSHAQHQNISEDPRFSRRVSTSSEISVTNNPKAPSTAVGTDADAVTATVPAPAPPSKAGNILADLSQLQRDVDALRGQVEKKA